MMLIGMMIFGTTTGFGKTTIVKKQNTHITVVKKQTPDKNCHCKNCEDIRKKQEKKTVNYCDCKNCTKQKKDNNATARGCTSSRNATTVGRRQAIRTERISAECRNRR